MAFKGYYHYNPSLAAAAIFAALFGLATLLHIYQMIRTRAWFYTAFIVGGIFEVIGFAARAINANETPNWSFGVFLIQSLGILLAPSLFAASIYMILGRIILLVEGEKYSLVRRTWLTKIFVLGDVASFLVQGLGGSLLAQKDANKIKLGRNIIMVGLWLQIIFFGLFLLTGGLFWLRLRRAQTPLSKSMPWQKHMWALMVASALILVRCIYRIIEYITMTNGTSALMENEVYAYVLDAALMLVMMCIFHYYHPSEITSLRNGGKVAVIFRVFEVVGHTDAISTYSDRIHLEYRGA